MSLHNLYWMKDTKVSTTWDKNTSKTILNIKVQRKDECWFLKAIFTSDIDPQKDSFSDNYWCIIWAKIGSLKSIDSWYVSALSNQVKAKLALSCLWDLMREIDNMTSNDTKGYIPDVKLVSHRVITLYLHLMELNLIFDEEDS
jgi:hypothetical protein